jgi:signal transduction histidine kinase
MKLLNYSTQRFLGFSVLLVLINIPIFYVVLEKIFIYAIDKSLYKQAALLPAYTQYIKSENDLRLWKNLDWDIEIKLAGQEVPSKKPFTIVEYSKEEKNHDQYRALQTKVKILNKDYIITFKSSLFEKNELILAVLGLQTVFLILLLLGSIYINHYINKKIWNPFREILDYLKTFDLEKNTVSVNKQLKIDEFKELSSSVNDLTDRVKLSYLTQKEFTENASHELQTPVAIIRFKLELLLQEEQLSETQSHLIEEINTVLTGLGQMNMSLLLLSKMDNQQFPLDEEFCLNKLIRKDIDELEFFKEGKKQKIIFSAKEELLISGNQQLFSQLITNLLINAIKYSSPGSEIWVKLSPSCLDIINPGEALSFPAEKLFERFSKVSEKAGGNNLGLAICKKITQLHQMQLNYNYLQGKHHFSIQF